MSPGLLRTAVAGLVVSATAACEDTLKPNAPSGSLAAVAASYLCENDFDITSASAAPLTVQYTVLGTSEQGALLLPPRQAVSTPSTTRLTTLRSGALRLSSGTEAISPVRNTGSACASPPAGPEPERTLGEWTRPFAWPIVAVHLHLLPTAEVLSWGRVGEPQIWNPATGAFSPVPSTTMLFCSGHAFLPDGRLLVTGGHLDEEKGLPDVNVFDPDARQWTAAEPMRRGRWYPTNTTLPDGQILTLAGRDEAGVEVEIPEVWTGTAWRTLADAARPLPYYPRAFVAPNGLVFYAGELQESSYLDPAGSGRWLPAALSNYGRRDYGSAVMYSEGKVMIAGGSDPPDGAPTNTAELIDLSQPNPAWRYTDAMSHARRQFNTTVLPDGSVLATGGTSASGFSDPGGAVHAAELWDPNTERWRILASNAVTRVYHSTSLLLPDGRVLHTGSGDGVGLPRELNAELFSPPYLFWGSRPSITEAPASIAYGEQFFVATPEGARVVRATLVRLGSVTHGFDQNQRFLELPLRRAAGGLTVTAPSTASLAPPGHYLFFILGSNGVPSIGRIVRVS